MFGFFKRKPVLSVQPMEARDLCEKGEIRLVDVREAGEWSQQRIPGAIHAPLSSLEQALETLPTGCPVVFYCLSGKRSATAVEICRGLGLPHDRHLEGGIAAWRAAGLPLAR
jgi:rhodanese-related sulfurtransferase